MKVKSTFLMLALVICSVLWIALPKTASADDNVLPLNLYTKTLTISGNIDVVTGTLSSSVTIKTSETCNIYITSDVYKYVDGDWQFVKSFRNPSSGNYVGMSKSYFNSCKVDKGYNYKIVATAYVTSVADQISETISQSSKILSYKQVGEIV